MTATIRFRGVALYQITTAQGQMFLSIPFWVGSTKLPAAVNTVIAEMRER